MASAGVRGRRGTFRVPARAVNRRPIRSNPACRGVCPTGGACVFSPARDGRGKPTGRRCGVSGR